MRIRDSNCNVVLASRAATVLSFGLKHDLADDVWSTLCFRWSVRAILSFLASRGLNKLFYYLQNVFPTFCRIRGHTPPMIRHDTPGIQPMALHSEELFCITTRVLRTRFAIRSILGKESGARTREGFHILALIAHE